MDAAGLKRSWSLVAQYGDQVPLFFYSSLFLTYPQVREMFPVAMASQRDKLVTALGQIVSNVDDLEALMPMLQQLGRDHRKFAVVREHYPAVGATLLSTLAHFSGPEWTEELARDWAAAYGLVAKVMIDAAEAAAAEMPPWWECEVVACERRTLDVAVITVKPNYQLTYRAGQSLAVETPFRPRLWRYYSPATLPAADGSFELHVRIVGGGPVSTALVQNTQPGDVLRTGAPVGHQLTVDPADQRDLVLLAGGTGLAPMKAILQQVRIEGGTRRVQLFWGTRQRRELYDLPALRALADGDGRIGVVPCVSHEPAFDGDVESGSVVEVALRTGAWTDHEVYICGSPEMVRGTAMVLKNAGTPYDRVHIEEFGTEETLA